MIGRAQTSGLVGGERSGLVLAEVALGGGAPVSARVATGSALRALSESAKTLYCVSADRAVRVLAKKGRAGAHINEDGSGSGQSKDCSSSVRP
jgi:hypothetical protein